MSGLRVRWALVAGLVVGLIGTTISANGVAAADVTSRALAAAVVSGPSLADQQYTVDVTSIQPLQNADGTNASTSCAVSVFARSAAADVDALAAAYNRDDPNYSTYSTKAAANKLGASETRSAPVGQSVRLQVKPWEHGKEPWYFNPSEPVVPWVAGSQHVILAACTYIANGSPGPGYQRWRAASFAGDGAQAPAPTEPTEPTEPGGPSTPEPTNKPCSVGDVIYIGVRGSGQTSGMGDQAWTYYNQSLRPATEKAKLTSKSRHVDYPSESTDLIFDGRFPQFKASYEKGVANLRRRVGETFEDLVSALDKGENCANAKVVLGGYSQGAMVIHRFLQDPTWIAPNGHELGLGSFFGGAILLADPDGFPGDGLKKSRQGVVGVGQAGSLGGLIAEGTGSNLSKVTGRYAATSYSICAVGDVVCDAAALRNVPARFFGLNLKGVRASIAEAGTRVHTSAYKSLYLPPTYAAAANELTGKVVKAAKPE